MSGGKQVNVGLFARGTDARKKRDELWKDAYKRRNWDEARRESKKVDQALIEEGGYDAEEIRILRKYAGLFKNWNRKESLFNYVHGNAKELEPELRNEFFKEWEKDYPAEYKGFRFAK